MFSANAFHHDNEEGLLDEDTEVSDVESDVEIHAGSIFNDENFNDAMSKIPFDLTPEAKQAGFFAKYLRVNRGGN